MPSIRFLTSFGPGGIFALLVALGLALLTGGGFAFAFLELYSTRTLNPAEQYFGSANERWLKWVAPPGEPMYGSAGTCGAQADSHFDGTFLKECPTGCNCHASFDSIRSQFNSCMGNMTRHRAYTPHVDCDGRLAAQRHNELHGFLPLAWLLLSCEASS